MAALQGTEMAVATARVTSLKEVLADAPVAPVAADVAIPPN
jgi:hypothetical protein